ncbi:MAG TPA: DNA ligase D, partial [Moraxellaceae bacterium]
PLPDFLEPQLATLVSEIPRDGPWLSELKFDGYRLLARVQKDKVSLWTRNRQDWSSKLPAIAADLAALGLDDAWLDGELVAVDNEGRGSFELLQQAFARNRRGQVKTEARLLYYLFDALFLNGKDLRGLPQQERKQLLKKALKPTAGHAGALRYSDHITGRMQDVDQQACLQGEEGIIVKAADATYSSGRGLHWLKLKCLHRQEFVVGGYSDPEGGREGLGALLLGYYDAAGQLVYVGRTGTGFSQEQLRQLQAKLRRQQRRTSPFANALSSREADAVHWVSPRLVAEVKFAGWTRHHRLRQASFLGLREDKPARRVQEDRPSTRLKEVVAEKPAADKVAGVKITHPGRLVYAQEGLRKIDVARYYESMAEHLLPQLAGRPLSLLRCPDGIAQACFFQKHMTDSMPDFLRTVAVEEEAGKALYMLADSPRALLALVQMGVLEFHTWGARSDRLNRPDRMVFDLDPGPGVAWKEVQEGALLIRALLRELELPVYLKTSGGKGLHLEVPLLRVHTWEEIKDFSHGIALHLEHELPGRFLASSAKSRRQSRIFIDYLRNAPGATTIAAYSLRARAGAAVATPLRWKELPDIESAAAFTLENISSRLATLRKDPWARYESERVRIGKSLREAMRELAGR